MLLWANVICAQTAWVEAVNNAIALRKQGEYSAAIAQLKPVLVLNAQRTAVHLELAVNYFKLQQYSEAQLHLDQVRLDKSLNQRSRQIAEALQAVIDKQQARLVKRHQSAHKFSANGSVGLGYDDNANIGPDDAELDIGGRFLVPEAVKTSDSYKLMTLSAGYSYRRPKPWIIQDKAIGFSWHNRISSYAKQYDDLSRYDLSYWALNSGPQLFQPGRWQLYLPLQFVSIQYGDKSLVDYWEFNPVYSVLFSAHTFSVRGGLTDKQYVQPIDQLTKDGLRYRLGLEYRVKLNNSNALRTGVDFTDNRAQALSRSYQSLRGSLQFEHSFNAMFSAYTALSYEDFSYKAVNAPLYDEARQESLMKMTVGLSATIRQHFVTNLLWRYDDKSANQALYEYDRQRLEMNIGFKY